MKNRFIKFNILRYNNSLVCLQYVFPLLILCFTYGKIVYVLHDRKMIGDTRHNEHIKAKKKVSLINLQWLSYSDPFLLKKFKKMT